MGSAHKWIVASPELLRPGLPEKESLRSTASTNSSRRACSRAARLSLLVGLAVACNARRPKRESGVEARPDFDHVVDVLEDDVVLLDGARTELADLLDSITKRDLPEEAKLLPAAATGIAQVCNYAALLIRARTRDVTFAELVPVLLKLCNRGFCVNLYIGTRDGSCPSVPFPPPAEVTGVVFFAEGKWHSIDFVDYEDLALRYVGREERRKDQLLSAGGRAYAVVVGHADTVEEYAEVAGSIQREGMPWLVYLAKDASVSPVPGLLAELLERPRPLRGDREERE